MRPAIKYIAKKYSLFGNFGDLDYMHIKFNFSRVLKGFKDLNSIFPLGKVALK